MASKTKNAKQTLKRVLRIKHVRNSNNKLRGFFPDLVDIKARTIDEKLSKVQRDINQYQAVENSKTFGLFSNLYGRSNAIRAIVCSKRSIRRRSLFAAGRAGYGKRITGARMRSEMSKVRC